MSTQRSVTVRICVLAVAFALAPVAFAQRSFMVELGTDPAAAPAVGPTMIAIMPGETKAVGIYFEDAVGGNQLNAYQIVLPWFASGGAGGAVEYVDIFPGLAGGDSVFVNKKRADWVFANDPIAPFFGVTYNETPPEFFGCLFATSFGAAVDPGPGGNVPNPGGPNYVGQFTLRPSLDASGEFTLSISAPGNPDAPPSGYYATFGAPIAVVFQPLTITIAEQDCNDNGEPDDCDISCDAPGCGPPCGGSADCNGNDFPDECDPDCNDDGIADGCEPDLVDCNFNGIPDECEGGGCCIPAQGGCGQLTIELCAQQGGVFLGPCNECAEVNIVAIPEGGGVVFIHVIGPPVDCESGGPGPVNCPPGQPFIDPWTSPADGAMCHNFGVAGSPAIPADFFARGSEAFSGSVCLEGVPLGIPGFGDADTLIERTEDPFDRCSLPPESEVTVSVEVVALSLHSLAPITVIVSGQPETWDVAVDLSAVSPPPGTLTAIKTHCNGGTYTSVLNVLPRFTFTKVNDPGQVRVLDTGLEGLDPVTLEQDTPAPWVHDVSPPLDEDLDACSTFHPGFEQATKDVMCDCNNNTIRDRCDIESGFSQDCNANRIPDSCDIAGGTSVDANEDGVPDECPTIECIELADCADLDDDGIRDDACAWYDCLGGNCVNMMKTTQADIGDLSGACPPDTSCDGGDRFHALNCFSDKDTTGLPPYPCESSAPNALNVDAGSQSSCLLDGVCDGLDAFHALNCFSDKWFDGSIGYQCSCFPQPWPPGGPVARLQRAALSLRAPASARPGELVAVDVYLDSALKALRGYQLHLGSGGGTRGELDLVDISVNAARRDYAFAGESETWSAFNRSVAQMMVGMDAADGAPAPAGSYLATFTYRVPKDAAGTFTIEVRYDRSSAIPQDRTFLFGSYAGPIDVVSTTRVRITVIGGRERTSK